MKNPSKTLMVFIQSFFTEYLATNRGLSPNTIMAYRDAIKMFLIFVAEQQKTPVAKLTPEGLTARLTMDFLKQLEDVRRNSIITRNLRLAALRTFFLYLSAEYPMRAGEYQKIIAIPLKRAVRPMMGYLEVGEMKAVLEGIDRSTLLGERDYVLLNLLYNTGARVQEICDLQIDSIRLESPAIVTLLGKGKKVRQVPLWEETKLLVQDYLKRRNLSSNSKSPLFLNSNGESIGRFGVRHIIKKRVEAAKNRCPSLTKKKIGPHTFRHTTAMHLLQSGVELSVIRSWLGHVSLSTTHAYVEIDLEMKRKALASCRAIGKVNRLDHVLHKNRDVIRWLETL